MLARTIVQTLVPFLVVLGCGDSKSPKPEPKRAEVLAPAVTDAAPIVDQMTTVLTNTVGTVEVRRDGEWSPAKQGESLRFDDSLRTQDGAKADLELGQVKVVLEPRSEVTVREMSDEVKNLRLDKGILAAKVQGGGAEKLRVRAAGSSAVAEASEGDFTVFNDGKGLVAVAPSSGEVRLTSNGGDQVLASGQRGVVTDNSAPTVDQVPRSVLLNVNWPTDELVRPQQVIVTGTVSATSRVEINGVSVPVSRDGSFQAPVALERGKNPVSVVARDFTGTQRSTTTSIDVVRKPPKAHADTKDLWKKK